MEEEEIKSRFSEEIKALGISKNAIAQEIGFSAQTFTNVTSGRNLPGVLLLNRIQRRYPSFDSNYVVTGIRTGEDSEKVKSLIEEVDYQKAIVSKLVGKAKGATLCPDRDKEFRIEGAKQMMHNARRAGKRKISKPMSVRVQGVKAPSLIDLFEK